MGFLYKDQMEPIQRLFNKQKSKYLELLSDLKEADVKTDSSFKYTVSRIKYDVLLEPITFKEPKIANHRGNGIFYVEVEFGFTGHEELFTYYTEAYDDDGRAIQQPHGNSIVIDVETSILKKEDIISSAKENIKDIVKFIEDNNKAVAEWSKKMNAIIGTDLEKRRNEIIALYS